MTKLRLFANLREIAGTSTVDIPSKTVGSLIEAASDRYGPEFRRGVQTSRVWINGESASMEDRIDDDDEVVLIPPVSGGGQPSAISTVDLVGFVPLVIAAVAILASLQGKEIWAAALVAISAVWAVDLGRPFAARGRSFAPLAVTVTSAGSVIAAHVLGGTGYGLSLGIAVVVALGWAVAFPAYRDIASYSPILLVSLIAGLGSASMILARSPQSPDESALNVFLVTVIAGVLLGALLERLPALPFLDPFSVTAVGSVLAAVAAAAFWDLDVVGYLLVGLGVSIALVAGRGLSSILRTGQAVLTQRPPGVIASIDAVVLAAAIYYPLISLIL